MWNYIKQQWCRVHGVSGLCTSADARRQYFRTYKYVCNRNNTHKTHYCFQRRRCNWRFERNLNTCHAPDADIRYMQSTELWLMIKLISLCPNELQPTTHIFVLLSPPSPCVRCLNYSRFSFFSFCYESNQLETILSEYWSDPILFLFTFYGATEFGIGTADATAQRESQSNICALVSMERHQNKQKSL